MPQDRDGDITSSESFDMLTETRMTMRPNESSNKLFENVNGLGCGCMSMPFKPNVDGTRHLLGVGSRSRDTRGIAVCYLRKPGKDTKKQVEKETVTGHCVNAKLRAW